MLPRLSAEPSIHMPHDHAPATKLAFNADIAAIGIALLMAALVRWNLIPHIGW